MSGLACAISLPIFASTPWWSSQFRRLYFSSPAPLPLRPPVLGAECLYVSRQACSSTTISRLVVSFSAAVRGVLGATGIMVGFSGGEGGAARLRDVGPAESSVLDEGTNAGDAPESGVDDVDGLAGVDMVRGG